MRYEYLVMKDEGSDRKVGGVIDLDTETLGDRLSMVSGDLSGNFLLQGRYPLSRAAAQVLSDVERLKGSPDLEMRKFIALVYLQGRMDMRKEMLEAMQPKD